MKTPMKQISFILLFLTFSASSFAKSFGTVGASFAVAEMSLLDFITNRLKTLEKNGDLNAMQSHWQEQAAAHADRPKALALSRVTKRSTHYYKPEIVLNQAIIDHLGQVLYPIGTKVNALERLPNYAPCWLFFNVDEIAQVKWAGLKLSHCANPKLILTAGSVKDAENALQEIIYFDQEGRLTQKLHIASVPAMVTRENNALRIDEVVIKENGHEI